MKETHIALLQLSFGNDIPKTIEYIKDTGIETIIVGEEPIKADDFCNNINSYYQLTN
jgi:hypothetical protein